MIAEVYAQLLNARQLSDASRCSSAASVRLPLDAAAEAVVAAAAQSAFTFSHSHSLSSYHVRVHR